MIAELNGFDWVHVYVGESEKAAELALCPQFGNISVALIVI